MSASLLTIVQAQPVMLWLSVQIVIEKPTMARTPRNWPNASTHASAG